MLIYDLFLTEMSNDTVESLPQGYADEEDDQSILKLSDLRKTRLTLGQLNKLRVMNDVRSVEHEQKLKKVSTQYKPAEQPEGGM
jgi:hypothetical protein